MNQILGIDFEDNMPLEDIARILLEKEEVLTIEDGIFIAAIHLGLSKGDIFEGDEGTKGGPGSGNFGHAGRPGSRSGSAPGGGHRQLVESYGFTLRDEEPQTVANQLPGLKYSPGLTAVGSS